MKKINYYKWYNFKLILDIIKLKRSIKLENQVRLVIIKTLIS